MLPQLDRTGLVGDLDLVKCGVPQDSEARTALLVRASSNLADIQYSQSFIVSIQSTAASSINSLKNRRLL